MRAAPAASLTHTSPVFGLRRHQSHRRLPQQRRDHVAAGAERLGRPEPARCGQRCERGTPGLRVHHRRRIARHHDRGPRLPLPQHRDATGSARPARGTTPPGRDACAPAPTRGRSPSGSGSRPARPARASRVAHGAHRGVHPSQRPPHRLGVGVGLVGVAVDGGELGEDEARRRVDGPEQMPGDRVVRGLVPQGVSAPPSPRTAARAATGRGRV